MSKRRINTKREPEARTASARERRPSKFTRFTRAVVVVLSLLLLAYFSHTLMDAYFQLCELNAEIKKTEKLMEAERKKQGDLAEKMELLHDPQYLEAEAREQLGLVRPGDVLYRLYHRTR